MTTGTGHEVALPSHIDVAADARVIKSVAEETIQTILNKRAEMDGNGLQREPLFVALGENHSISAHELHQLAVLEGLRRTDEPVAMAFEYPHDQLLRSYEEEAGFQRTPVGDVVLRQQDRERAGTLTLQNDMVGLGCYYSDHAVKTVMQYCRKTETPSVFTDAARLDGYLDKNDPITRDSIASCSGKLRSLFCISITGVRGVHVRNHQMLRCARQAAVQYDSRIILQLTGHDHVAGNRLDNNKVCNSLLGLSRHFFTAALGFIPLCSDFDEDNIDEHALASAGLDEDLHLCRVLPETIAAYDPKTDAPMKGVDLQSRKKEAAYIGGVLQAIGLGHHAMSAEDYWNRYKLDRQDLQERFAAIDRQTRAQSAAKPA